MSWIQSAALITRLREVLFEAKGTNRTVPVARFEDYPEGLDDETQTRRAFAKAQLRIDVDVLRRSKYSPPINGNLIIYDIGVTVTGVRAIERRQQLVTTLDDALAAAAMEDHDVIRQALEYPSNLTTTEAGTATDLVSGMLCFDDAGSTLTVTNAIDDGAQKLESRLAFKGWLISRPTVRPYNLVAPVLSGTVALGQLLAITPGTWLSSPTFLYTLKRNGVAVAGLTAVSEATVEAHVLVALDVAASLTVDEIATNTAGTATATSNALS